MMSWEAFSVMWLLYFEEFLDLCDCRINELSAVVGFILLILPVKS